MKRYLDFEEDLRQGEPQQRERAEAWCVAIAYDSKFLTRIFRNLFNELTK
ncbi:MAG: hypothetical protein IKY27_04665 [Bacteroidales bacterium]|nr:hypothetical protein [Bacteroidales bacterium]MBR5781258.1 hypothetical protein [Bacteroidales bacterium]